MSKVVLAGIFVLTASTALAQTGTAPTPNAGAPAAQSPATAAPSTSTAGALATPEQGGGPANLCRELVAFMTAPPADAASPSAAPPPRQNTSAQDQSQQAAPAHGAPAQQSSTTDGTTAQKAELKSSLSAPVPTDPVSTPKDSVMSAAEAEDLASANDIAACRDAARELRLAGVAVPTPLLALTALDLRYHQSDAPR